MQLLEPISFSRLNKIGEIKPPTNGVTFPIYKDQNVFHIWAETSDHKKDMSVDYFGGQVPEKMLSQVEQNEKERVCLFYTNQYPDYLKFLTDVRKNGLQKCINLGELEQKFLPKK